MQVDIFSFGMFMFELLTCRQPLKEISNPTLHVSHGGRPSITSEVNMMVLNLSQTGPCFYMSAVQVFLKKLWEKEKLLVASSFSFSHSVFYPFGELSAIFIKCGIVVCKLF